jgi:hypothetical protein
MYLKMSCHCNVVVCTIDMKAVGDQMDADQEERKAERKAYQEQMLSKTDAHQERMKAIMNAWRK